MLEVIYILCPSLPLQMTLGRNPLKARFNCTHCLSFPRSSSSFKCTHCLIIITIVIIIIQVHTLLFVIANISYLQIPIQLSSIGSSLSTHDNFCILAFVFAQLYWCICIFAFVSGYLYLGICIWVFVCICRFQFIRHPSDIRVQNFRSPASY